MSSDEIEVDLSWSSPAEVATSTRDANVALSDSEAVLAGSGEQTD